MFLKKDRSSKDKKQVIKLYKDHVSSGKVDFYNKYKMDFVMGYREGSRLFDIDGKKEIYNLHSNGGVFNLGHRNKEIVNLLKEQLNFYDIGNHHLMSKPRADLAVKIAQLMPGDLDYSIFGVSGGEAIDLALKIARAYTKRKKIVSVEGGYHGHTGLSVQTGDDQYKAPFLLDSSDFLQIPFNDLEALQNVLDQDVATVILETIPATLGMPLPKEGYLKKVKELCENNGSLLILDEVQAGLGRTGKLWAFEHFNVIPDIVVLAKGLSGGIYPISATVIDKKLESVFHNDPFIHISTSGGAELGCMVALKVLEITSEKSFLQHVNNISDLFYIELRELQKRHQSFFKGIRRLGLMMGLELKDVMAGPVMTKAAYDNDLLIIYANNDTSIVQFLPPLVMDEKDIKYIIKQLDIAFNEARVLHTALKIKENLISFLK